MGQRLQGGLFLRGCAQVLRIDGATGAVEWKLGGTAAPDGSTTEFLELVEHSDPSVVEEFCGQHHVTLTSSGTQAEYLREYRLPVSAAAIAIAGVGVALLAVLVPLILTLHGRVVAELGELRRDLHAIAERVARIEGALTGPWRPTNGSPAPASKTPPEATAE